MEDHPPIVGRLERLAAAMRSDLGAGLQEKEGAEVCPAGSLADSK